MKQFYNLKFFLIALFAIFFGGGKSLAQEPTTIYSTGFESSDGFTASTTYNNTDVKKHGNSGSQWGVVFGTPSTNKTITGSQSMQCRIYKSQTVEPYIYMDFDLTNVKSISFKSKADNTNLSLLLQYSTDGGTIWIDAKTFSPTSSAKTFSFTHDAIMPSVRYKFVVKYNNAPIATQAFFLDDIDVKGIENTSSDPVDAVWTVTPSEISVKAGKNATAAIGTNYDGQLTVQSTDESIATATYENGTLTVTGVAEGTTNIRFNGDATSKYNAIDKSISVTVLPNVTISGTYEITPNNTFYGTDKTYSGSSAPENGFLEGEQDGITVVYAKSESANFYVSTTQTRAYTGSTMTFSVPSGFVITNISFTADGSNWAGETTSSVGTMKGSKTWEGSAQEVIMTFNGTCRIAKITVTIAAEVKTSTITLAEACTDGTKYYGTYSSSKPFVVPDDITVSEIKVVDNKLTVKEYATGAVVPANTGVMVASSTFGDHTVALTSETGTSVLGEYNMLRATGDAGVTAAQMAANDADCKFYRLTMHKGETIGYFYGAAEGAAFAVAANKAYLAVKATMAAKVTGFTFGGDATGISFVASDDNTAGKRVIYNMQGQRVNEKAAKGLYIVNGKKVIIK